MSQQDNLPETATAAEPRKKRAKIMSACGECRRKKTKCNGEQPCRNCQKSLVNCIYPAAISLEDKRNLNNNNYVSKIVLEAIEDRLKTIEDMLKSILQQSFLINDLDPIAVNNFLNKSHQSPPSSLSSPTATSNSPLLNNRLPSIHNLSASLPAQNHQHHATSTSHQLPPLIDEYHQYEKEDSIDNSLLKKRKR